MEEQTSDDGQSDPSVPLDSWAGLTATAQQAMEWGIDLCGQLATVHAEGVVVGDIRPATIMRLRFGQPRLPEPDGRAVHDPWVDVSALAESIGAIVPDPPQELVDALLPPYASAVALGQELQDAQEAMGLPIAPIPFDGAPVTKLGGFPLEMAPGVSGWRSSASADATEVGGDVGSAGAEPPTRVDDDLGFDPAELLRSPNRAALLGIAVAVLVVALAIGVGWR